MMPPTILRPYPLSMALVLLLLAGTTTQAQTITAFGATDGAYEDRVELSWAAEDLTSDHSFHIERDGVKVMYLTRTASSWTDREIVLNHQAEYCLVLEDNSSTQPTELARKCDNGTRTLFAPELFVATNNLTDRIALRWADRSTINTEYRVYRAQPRFSTARNGSGFGFSEVAFTPDQGTTLAFWANSESIKTPLFGWKSAEFYSKFIGVGLIDPDLFAVNDEIYGIIDQDGKKLGEGATLQTKGWHFFVLRYDASSKLMHLFVDGAQAGSYDLSTVAAGDQPTSEWKVSVSDLSDATYSGVQVWSKALSEAEIAALQKSGPEGNEIDLLAFWQGYRTVPHPSDPDIIYVEDTSTGSTSNPLSFFKHGAPILSKAIAEGYITLSGSTAQFNFTAAPPGVEIEFCLAAAYVEGTLSVETAKQCVKGQRAFVLPPKNVVASDGQFTDRIRLTWTDGPPDETGYIVKRTEGERTSSSVFQTLTTTAPNFEIYDDLTAEAGKTYTYCVVATKGSGQDSFEVCDTGSLEMPAPYALALDGTTRDDGIALTWSYDLAAIDGFRIERYHNGTKEFTTEVGADARQYLDTSVIGKDPALAYTYHVIAYSTASGTSVEKGVQADFTVTRTVVVAPHTLDATDGAAETSVSLAWENTSTSAVVARIWRGATFIGTTDASETSFVDDEVTPGNVYEYCIQHVTAHGVASDHTCAYGAAALGAPTGVSASDNNKSAAGEDVGEQGVRIAWTSNSDAATRYAIYRSPLPVPTTRPVRHFKGAGLTMNLLDLAPVDLASSYTVGFWALPLADDLTAAPLDEQPMPRATVLALPVKNGMLNLGFDDNGHFGISGDNIASLTASQPTKDRQWHYWAVTIDATSGQRAIYRDGKRVATGTDVLNAGTFGGGTGGNGRMNVGFRALNTDPFHGAISNIVIYRGTLSSDEIRMLATQSHPAASSNGLQGARPGRLVYLPMDEPGNDMRIYVEHTSHLIDGTPFSRIVPDSLGRVSAEETSFTDKTALPGASYSYSVIAAKGDGVSASGWDVGIRKLLAPSGLTASQGTSETSITLEWTDNSRVESGYQIYRNGTLVHTTAPRVTTYTDTVPSAVPFADVQYEVRTAVTLAGGVVGQSDAATATGHTAILAPLSLGATTTFPDHVQLVWDDNSTIRDGYRLYIGGVAHNMGSPAGTTYRYNDVFSGTREFCIVAYKGNQESEKRCAAGQRAPVVQGVSHTFQYETAVSHENILEESSQYTSLAVGEKYLAFGRATRDPYATDRSYYQDSATPGEVVVYELDEAAGTYAEQTRFNINGLGADIRFDNSAFFSKLADEYGIPSGEATPVESMFGYNLEFYGDDRLHLISNFHGITAKYKGDAWKAVARTHHPIHPMADVSIFKDNANLVTTSRLGRLIHHGNRGGSIWQGGVSLDRPAIAVWSESDQVPVNEKWQFQKEIHPVTHFALTQRDTTKHEFYRDRLKDFAEDDLQLEAFTQERVMIKAWHDDRVVILNTSTENVLKTESDCGYGKLGTASDKDFLAIGCNTVPGTDNFGNARVIVWDKDLHRREIGKPTGATDSFGHSVALREHMLAVSDPGAHMVYVYAHRNGDWHPFVAIHGYEAEGFGTMVGLSDQAVIIGAAEIAFVHPLVSLPSEVVAADGTSKSNVHVSWKDNTANEAGYQIYRDNQLVGEVGPNVTSFSDEDAPGGIPLRYCIAATIEGVGHTPLRGNVCDVGWRPAVGSIAGRIAVVGGTGVEGIEVDLDPSPTSAFMFDGESYIATQGALQLDGSPIYTVEFWVYVPEADQAQVFAFAYPSLGVSIIGGTAPKMLFGKIGSPYESDNLQVSVSPNQWHHVAFLMDVSNPSIMPLRMWIDGELHELDNWGHRTWYNVQFYNMGGPHFFGGKGFRNGRLEEVRIWKKTLTTEEITSRMYSVMTGNEDDLIAYYPLDTINNRQVLDKGPNGYHAFAVGGVFATPASAPVKVASVTDDEGNYTFTGLRFGDEQEFRVVPNDETRIFQPAHKKVVLSSDNPSQNEIEFQDASSFAVSGTILFAGEAFNTCPVPNIELLAAKPGDDFQHKAATEGDGHFQFALQMGTYDVKVQSDRHQFSQDIQRITVSGDKPHVDFVDQTLVPLRLEVHGTCDIPLGPVRVKVRAENGCFEQEYEVVGTKQLMLPPQRYVVEVVELKDLPAGLDEADVTEFFENLGPQVMDLTAARPDTMAMLYHAPLRVGIAGMPAPKCTSGGALANVPVLTRGTPVELALSFYEDYGAAGHCPVESGTLRVFDEFSGSTKDIEVKDGEAAYRFVPAGPNITQGRLVNGVDRSYQFSLTAIGEKEGRDAATATAWGVVEGAAPRTATFTTIPTHAEPILVLHDPPGDGSYAYIEEGTEICSNFESRIFASQGLSAEAEVGVGLTSNAGLGFSVETKVGATFVLEAGLEVNEEFKYARKLCTTFNKKISTSTDEAIPGQQSDVYVGLSFNYTFALADELKLDNQCAVELSEVLAAGLDPEKPINSAFVYTERHIENYLIPQLQTLAALNNTALDLNGAIVNWKRHLEISEKHRGDYFQPLDAASIPSSVDPEGVLQQGNLSFSGLSSFEFSQGSGLTESFGGGGGVSFSLNVGPHIKMEVAGLELEAKILAKLAGGFELSGSDETTNTTTYGFVLEDNDEGDFFTVDVGRPDMVKAMGDGLTRLAYDTFIFKLASGTSSIPWEPGTQPRDKVRLSASPPAVSDVPASAEAVITLGMSNLSESKEQRPYHLVPVAEQNPYGATIKVNGNPLQTPVLYFPKPDQTQNITMIVARGPQRYRYDSLAVAAYPVDAWDLWNNGAYSLQADTLYFDVHFAAACSDIAIQRPLQQSTLTNKEAGMEIILHDYLLNFDPTTVEDEVQSLGLEYRKVGTAAWTPVFNPVAAKDHPSNLKHTWMPAGGVEGVVELRAYTQCKTGRVHSPPIPVTIDRVVPEVFGTPAPASQVLALGDDASVTFTEPIQCNDGTLAKGAAALAYADGSSKGEAIATTATCRGSQLVLAPEAGWAGLEGRRVEATVTGVKDARGNELAEAAAWDFLVRRGGVLLTPSGLVAELPLGEAGRYEAEVVNGGGYDIRVRLTPSEGEDWLTVSPDTVTVPAGERAAIRLDVAATEAVGDRKGHIVADWGASKDTLSVEIVSACTPSGWAVDPARFDASMALTAQLYFPGVVAADTLSDDANDMIAAYVGDELRGVGHVQGTGSDAKVFMLVYGYQSESWTGSGSASTIVRLEAFDDSACHRYHKTTGAFAFEADGVRGTPTTPLKVVAPVPVEEGKVAVRPGWNWISLTKKPADAALGAAFGSWDARSGDLLKGHGEFATYHDGSWVGNLTELAVGEGYLLRSTHGGNLTFEGTAPTPSTVSLSLKRGWNWIGYVPQHKATVTKALENFTPAENDLIKSQTAFAQYSDGHWIGSLTHMEPGRAYKLKTTKPETGSPVTFHFPDNIPPSNVPALIAGTANAATISGPGEPVTGRPDGRIDDSETVAPVLPEAWTLVPEAHGETMSVIASLRLDGLAEDGAAWLGAFVGDEVRGVTPLVPTDEVAVFRAYLTVHGAEGEALTFRAFNGRTESGAGGAVFAADGVLGAVGQPLALVIEAKDDLPTAFTLEANYPNPVRRHTAFRYSLPVAAEARVAVYDALGRLVRVLADGKQEAGWHEVTFDTDGLASGTYFYRLETKDVVRNQRMVIVR